MRASRFKKKFETQLKRNIEGALRQFEKVGITEDNLSKIYNTTTHAVVESVIFCSWCGGSGLEYFDDAPPCNHCNGLGIVGVRKLPNRKKGTNMTKRTGNSLVDSDGTQTKIPVEIDHGGGKEEVVQVTVPKGTRIRRGEEIRIDGDKRGGKKPTRWV